APCGATATTRILTTKLFPAATSGLRLSASSFRDLAGFRFGLSAVSARSYVEVKRNNLRISGFFPGILDTPAFSVSVRHPFFADSWGLWPHQSAKNRDGADCRTPSASLATMRTDLDDRVDALAGTQLGLLTRLNVLA